MTPPLPPTLKSKHLLFDSENKLTLPALRFLKKLPFLSFFFFAGKQNARLRRGHSRGEHKALRGFRTAAGIWPAEGIPTRPGSQRGSRIFSRFRQESKKLFVTLIIQ